jgi:hypothetical protein
MVLLEYVLRQRRSIASISESRPDDPQGVPTGCTYRVNLHVGPLHRFFEFGLMTHRVDPRGVPTG